MWVQRNFQRFFYLDLAKTIKTLTTALKIRWLSLWHEKSLYVLNVLLSTNKRYSKTTTPFCCRSLKTASDFLLLAIPGNRSSIISWLKDIIMKNKWIVSKKEGINFSVFTYRNFNDACKSSDVSRIEYFYYMQLLPILSL